MIEKLFNYLKNRLVLRKKARNIKDKIRRGESILNKSSVNVQIQTVSQCNGKCMFCPYVGSWQDLNQGKMDDITYVKIIDELRGYKIEKFCPYFENEPLFDKELFSKIKYAYEVLSPQIVELATNLSVFTPFIEKEMVKLFQKIPHEIRISFHGINENSYLEIMGLNFEKSLSNIHRLIKVSQDTNLNIQIRGGGAPRVAGKLKNWFSEEEYLLFWEEQLKPYKNKPKITFFTYHDRAVPKQLKEKGMIFSDIIRKDLKGFYCARFDKWLHFLYTGEPVLCCMDYNRETVYSKSIREVSLKEMINSNSFTELIKKGTGIIESEDDFICKRCISPEG